MVLFSIITVCRNAETIIPSALASLSSQTFQDWEWIMVDGASTDNTVKMAQLLHGKGRRQQIISEPDSGIYEAMNKGVRAARGKYVHFLNADDTYFDDKVLEDVAAELAQFPEADFIYGNIVVTSEGKPDVLHSPPPPEGALEEMVCGCLPHQGSFTKLRLFFEQLGMLNEQLRTASDYQWMLNAVAHPDVKLHYMDRTIARFSADGMSSQLDTSLPESFQVLNANTMFQEAIGVPVMLGCYQRQILILRKELQLLREKQQHAKSEKDNLVEKYANLKTKLSETREKLDELRLKSAQSKKSVIRRWWHRWM